MYIRKQFYIISCALVLTACNNSANEKNVQEVTFPQSLVESKSKKEIEKQSKKVGSDSYEIHEDGSVTIFLTESEIEQQITHIEVQLQKLMKKYIESNDQQLILNITNNSDYTQFIIVTANYGNQTQKMDNDIIELTDLAASLQPYLGKTEWIISVKFIDSITAQTVSSYNLSSTATNLK